ncbi:LysR family transcriptional regulator [Colwellia sp. RSH04]|uniref:LysR family transcriptional regulator n=1 Tax=Colwellia sp. RSH04 TaxID=2305464 RepID=UPI000E57735B|nr:LysR family transcriptional regulator [Colwellia sp. RSH04]RHW76481.1 LysR family transcriptional regulator [Colwellia sp. RSH04]
MQLSMEQLEAFVTTVETGSFSAAARKLGKAQSSISGLISNLEVDTGFDLFDRSSRSPSLTKEGLSLLNDIKTVTKSHNNLVHRISNMVEDVENEISIAYDETALSSELIFELMLTFEEKFPSTSLLLITAPHNRASQLLKAGKVDLAITLSQDDYPEEFAFRGIAHSHYSTIVSKNHPLALQKSVSPNELTQFRHIRITDCETGYRHFDSELSTKLWYTNNTNLLILAVKNNVGWADLPLNLIKHELETGELVKLPTTHQTVTYPHCVDIIWQSEIPHGQCLKWLIDNLTKLGSKAT